MTVRTIAVACALLCAAEAQAKPGPYQWGIGVKVGTSFIPGLYPSAFPSKIANYDFIDEDDPSGLGGDPDSDDPKRDLESVGGAQRFSSLARVGADARLGAEGFYGIDERNRLGGGIGVGLGKQYLDFWGTLNYDRVLTKEGKFALVGGAQIGYGSATFSGDDTVVGGPNERLLMPYYPVRVRGEAQFRGNTNMVGVGLFLQDAIPARAQYTDLDGVVQDNVAGFGNFVRNFSLGIELDVQFGDFKPPPPKQPGAGKGPKGGKGGKRGR
jgi:hypothetical protein